MALTIAAVAAHKGIALGRLSVSVESHTRLAERRAATRFIARVDLGDGLDPRERRILFNSAKLCEVHKMLRGEITFDETLAE